MEDIDQNLLGSLNCNIKSEGTEQKYQATSLGLNQEEIIVKYVKKSV